MPRLSLAVGRMLSRMEALAEHGRWLIAELGNTHPIVFFAAMALLPLGPFPASVLFISAGVRFGFVAGTATALAALAINMSLGYWLARTVVRHPLERWFKNRRISIPTFDRGDEIRLLLLFRITPGMPLFVQNYALGLSGIRFGRYLPISLVLQIPYIVGFAWFGQALTQSSGWKAGMGVTGLAALMVAVSLLRRLASRRSAAAAPPRAEAIEDHPD